VELFTRIANWARGRDSAPTFTVFKGPDGGNVIVDSAMMDYLSSTAPEPTQVALDFLMDQSCTVRVFQDGCQDDKLLSNKVLLHVVGPADVAALRATLKIADGPGGHCMCFGGPTLEMLSADGSRLALLSIHHGHAIRWNRWKDDPKLVNGRGLLEWLAQRDVVEPLREFETQEAHETQRARDLERWLGAMPIALIPIWSGVIGKLGEVAVESLRTVLARDLPDERERILALLGWFGSGAGPWSGFPAYRTATNAPALGERLLTIG